MKFTTVLSALASLGQLGVAAAKPRPVRVASAGPLSRRSPGPGQGDAEASAADGEPKAFWTYTPQFEVPALKKLWEGAACTAAHTTACREAYITGGPFHGEEQEWKRRGRYIFVSTEKAKNMRVFVNGSIAGPKAPGPPTRPRAQEFAWADGSERPQLGPSATEAWQKTVCNLTGRMDCEKTTITRGPHDGQDAANLARHGPHVHVTTDKHKDLQVYADGTGRIRGP